MNCGGSPLAGSPNVGATTNMNENNSFSGASLLRFDGFCDGTMDEWYDAKHSKPSQAELDLVNGLAIERCPRCGSKRFKKSGHYKNGIARLRCLRCGRAFSPLTGTLFDSHKIPISEWIEYLMHLLEFHSVTSSARDNRNAKNTGKYWISKIFAALSGCQDGIVLSGRVYIDETYFSVKPKDEAKNGGKHYRGLSRNKICVATATDGTNAYLAVCGSAKPSRAKLLKSFRGHIKNGSTIVHDGERCHAVLIDAFGMKEELHKSSETKGLADKDNPMEPINAIHRALKRFMRSHPSYDRGGLQDWLNLFWFIVSNEELSLFDKAKKLLQTAILTQKIVRYRDVLSKKFDK